MWNALIDSDPSDQILSAYVAKEELRHLLSAARDGADDAENSRRRIRFHCTRAQRANIGFHC